MISGRQSELRHSGFAREMPGHQPARHGDQPQIAGIQR